VKLVARRAVAALIRNDLRKLGRDPILLIATIVPVVLALALRFGLAPLEHAVRAWIDLGSHRATIVAGAAGISAMLAGWVVGFMLLEERAQRMIEVFAVTPLTLRGFVAWRLLSPTALGLLGCLSAVVLVGEFAGPGGLVRALCGAGLMAMTAPLFALALVSLADNEVEGLVVGKFGGLVVMLPLVAVIREGPWSWLAGLLPSYWAIRLMVGGGWVNGLVGLAVIGAWSIVLLRRLSS
jgi:hypothetical protein